MNKTELVSAMAKEAELSKKDAEKALNAFTNTIEAELKNGGKVQILGFGIFETSVRKEREGKNPKTKKAIVIPRMITVKFKAGKPLKDAINSYQK